MSRSLFSITSFAVAGLVLLGVFLSRQDETGVPVPVIRGTAWPAIADGEKQPASITLYPAAPNAKFVPRSVAELQRQKIVGNTRFKRQIEADLFESIDQTYVPVLTSFGLSNEVVAKLRDLLIERFRVSRDAVELGFLENNRVAETVLVDARAEVDREIASLVAPEIGQKINLMLQASPQLGGLSGGLAETFAKRGAPLTPQQQYTLAVTDYQVFYGPGTNPDGGASLPIDPASGLNKLDREYLARLEGTLSLAQLAIARQRRVNIHRRENAIHSTTPMSRVED